MFMFLKCPVTEESFFYILHICILNNCPCFLYVTSPQMHTRQREHV